MRNPVDRPIQGPIPGNAGAAVVDKLTALFHNRWVEAKGQILMRPVYSLAASCELGASDLRRGLALGRGEVAIVRLLCSPATMLHDIAFEGRKLRQDSPKPLAGAL